MSQIPCGRTRAFFEEGTPEQFHWALGMYDKCLRIKAEKKSQKPDNIIKLDPIKTSTTIDFAKTSSALVITAAH